MKGIFTAIFTLLFAYCGLSQSFRSILFHTSSTDNGLEFIEITGTPGMPLTGMHFINIIGKANSTEAGVMRTVIDLGSYSLGANGLLLIRDASTEIAPGPDPETEVAVENFKPNLFNGTNTFVIVSGFTGNEGDDIDTNDDGTADITPWSNVVTSISTKQGVNSKLIYADDFGGTYIQNPYGKGFLFYYNNQWNFANMTGDIMGMSVTDGTYSGRQITPGKTAAVLPVDLSLFVLRKSNKDVMIEWQTASEQNNAGFDVEKSNDGSHFESIAKINGAGDSQQFLNYSYTDSKPFNGINYYRLKQTDTDGGFTYSPVKSIRISQSGSVSLYPAVAVGQLTLSFSDALTDDTKLDIVDLGSGRIAHTSIIAAKTKEYNLSTDALPVGTYSVVLNGGAFSESLKFVVAK
ncbi:MAG TPA: hypothetical protein PLP81_10965 [Saprospiraceae bacterium]|nr:hypothetical protein [Saprospiraceae bacterium]HNL29453.1 hypothetical protein [Saprospiraceae bacterium]